MFWSCSTANLFVRLTQESWRLLGLFLLFLTSIQGVEIFGGGGGDFSAKGTVSLDISVGIKIFLHISQ